MIKVGDKYLRNLEEQVQYLTSYHEVNQGLVQWGIRVVGKVATAAELPDAETYEGEYGDAYAVGTEPSYDFYIWTRPTIEGGSADWFAFGKISIAGPVGPAGPQGPKGDTGESTQWYYGTTPTNPVEGDMVLMANGDVRRYQQSGESYAWVTVVNIKGSQGIQGDTGPQGPRGERGPQGPKGDTGDVGGFINIYGVLASTSLLPTPAYLNNLTVAYLVGAASPYDLYVQIGKNSDEAVWTNTGPFNAATAVSVNGSYQNIWNADTKLDKVTKGSDYPQVYVKEWNGTQSLINIIQNPSVNGFGIPARTYVDGYFAKKPTDTSEYTRVIAQKANGDATSYPIYSPSMSSPNQFGSIPTYDENLNVGYSDPGATIAVNTPKGPYAAANKAYVDGIFSLSGTTLTITTE